EVITSARVTAINREGNAWRVHSTAGDYECARIVTCAGLQSDRLAALTGANRTIRIVPFRGEYYKIRPERQYLVRNLIYPVPDPKFPFLGVHFTRLIHGGVEAGPNAVLALAREGYSWTDINPRDIFDAITFNGLWRFLGKYPKMCWQETRRSFSRKLFCASLQRLVPEIRPDDLSEGGAGVRAQAMSPDGSLVEDFHFVEGPGELHVVNAPSPGATASLAIGEEIAKSLK
ncbi:MAG: L-2-hydroxyglutarate oxidase, partial [Bryobacteraceae bacterium]